MKSGGTRKSRIPFEFSASFILQMLGAIAAFLGAIVLPLSNPELGSFSAKILGVVGAIFLIAALVNVLFGKRISVLFQRVGMRSRVMLPREGLIYLGVMLMLAVAALLGQRNMLFLIFGMMAGPFVFNGWVVMTMLQKVSVVRVSPPSAEAGEYFSVEIRIRNAKRFLSSRLVQVRDVIEGNRLREEVGVTFVRIPPTEARSGSYRLKISRRGRYRFGPLRVSSRFPLGISERGRAQNDYAEIFVHPAIGRLLPAWRRREQELSEAIQLTQAKLGVFEDEFHRIREFRTGDNPRAIHWRTTARRGELMVREYEQHRESDLVVLLDLHKSADFDDAEVELAVSLTATICVEQTRRTSSAMYRLYISAAENQDIQCPGAGRFREAALDALAECEASVKASLKWLVENATQTAVRSGDRFVLVTPRADEARAIVQSISDQANARTAVILSRLMIVSARRADLSTLFERHEAIR